MDVIYLDNNATTRPAPQVLDAMLPYMSELYGNPSSVHRFGQMSRQAIDEARAQIATLLDCSETEVMFSGGGTEAINTALRGLLAVRAPRKRIVTSTVEHSATRELCAELARGGAEIVEVGVDPAGRLDFHALRDAVTADTALVTIMWANNETGVIFDVKQIAEICRAARVPFHCDATQAIGKVPVHPRQIGIDAMSFASHKFHGPKGVGGLFVRRGLRLPTLLIGGPQERGRRGGTENVAGIVGMGTAAVLAMQSLSQMIHVAALRNRLESSLLQSIDIAHVNGAEPRIPNTTNIGFAQLESEAVLLLLSEQSLCASAGSACASGSLEPSHVLRAMRIDDKIAHGAVRFSLSRYTTEQEIDQALELIPRAISRLRQVLPVGRHATRST